MGGWCRKEEEEVELRLFLSVGGEMEKGLFIILRVREAGNPRNEAARGMGRR